MGTAPGWWRRAARLLLLTACVLVSASYSPADEAVSIHECCATRYEDHPEPAVSRRPAPHDETPSISPRCLAFGFVSFLLGAIVGWLIRKVPKQPVVEQAIRNAIDERKRQADVHSIPTLKNVLDEAGTAVIAALRNAWNK